MKIFDSSPKIRVERPHRQRTILAVVAATAMIIAIAVAYLHQRSAHTAQLGQLRSDLATANGKVSTLLTEVSNLKEKLDATGTRIKSCTGDLADETSKVAAFAKQAAACEAIRLKLKSKG